MTRRRHFGWLMTLPVAVLLLAFLQAPFFHTHQHVNHHERWNDLCHFHLQAPPADSLGWQGPDQCADAQFLDWVASIDNIQTQWLATTVASPQLPALHSQPRQQAPQAVRNHDPPWRLHSAPRAPPA